MTTRIYPLTNWTDGNGTFTKGSIVPVADSVANIYRNQGLVQFADGPAVHYPMSGDTGDVVTAKTDPLTGVIRNIVAGSSIIRGVNPSLMQSDVARQLSVVGNAWTVVGTAGTPTFAQDASKTIECQPGVVPLVCRGSASADGQYVRATTTIPSTTSSDISISVPVYIEDYTKIQNIQVLVSKDGFATTSWATTYSVSQAGNMAANGLQIVGINERISGLAAGSQFTTGNGATTEDAFTSLRLQVNYLNGSAGSAVYFGNPVVNGKGRGRMTIEFDDGDASIFSRVDSSMAWNAIDYMYAKGLRGTFNLIYSRIGTAGYITENHVRKLMDMGHCICVHGDYSLASLANDSARRADVAANLNGLRSLGVPDDMLLAQYAFPNGVYENTPGDQSIIKIIQDYGFKSARGANRRSFEPNYAGYGYRWTGNILGHYDAGYAGGAETVAIDKYRTDQLVSTGGLGRFLFHKIILSAFSANIQIKLSDFMLLCDYWAAYAAAGSLDIVTPQDNVTHYGL